MVEWGYLLRHLSGYMRASKFREAVIEAERKAIAAKQDRIPLLVDIALAAMDHAGFGGELDVALVAAGYLPSGEDDDEED